MESKDVLQVILKEYETLKTEQFQRIAVRDNVIYLMIVSLGLLISLLEKLGTGLPLLVVPWASFILGWTYLVNDEKVSAVGRYIRIDMDARIKSIVSSEEDLLGWETVHRSDSDRTQRKKVQFIVDLIVFVMPAFLSIYVYLTHYHTENLELSSFKSGTPLLCTIEAIFLFYLGVKIFKYADFKFGK